jgi:hypothetical protein
MLYLHIPPLSLKAASSKMAHSRNSQDMLLKLLAQHSLKDGLAGVVQFCVHLGALIRHNLAFSFGAM